MSSLSGTEPIRTIRNALERLALVAEGTPMEDHVAAERILVEEALRVIEREVGEVEERTP